MFGFVVELVYFFLCEKFLIIHLILITIIIVFPLLWVFVENFHISFIFSYFTFPSLFIITPFNHLLIYIYPLYFSSQSNTYMLYSYF